ncbi:hypothetical protein V9T40_006129 [Parthenolecanium corni]|uniref:Uncharacterized protein n=1 Tax=Parthenolecanium corni TaxID=536013 RepID=A0AAN9U4A4_9HEMI
MEHRRFLRSAFSQDHHIGRALGRENIDAQWTNLMAGRGMAVVRDNAVENNDDAGFDEETAEPYDPQHPQFQADSPIIEKKTLPSKPRVTRPIVTGSFNDHAQIDLMEFQSEADGEHNLSMIAVRQKPRRNDGSTMSTTSPSSGCFSVALMLLTIFLDSLRASKYCSVQIVQSSCRYPGLNSNTHTNEPPIPGTQF